jgi:hypothetical protein
MFISETRTHSFVFYFLNKEAGRHRGKIKYFVLPLIADTLCYVNCIPVAPARG